MAKSKVSAKRLAELKVEYTRDVMKADRAWEESNPSKAKRRRRIESEKKFLAKVNEAKGRK